jgi:hypothetical protein
MMRETVLQYLGFFTAGDCHLLPQVRAKRLPGDYYETHSPLGLSNNLD